MLQLGEAAAQPLGLRQLAAVDEDRGYSRGS
jgi:hypothetical protein